MSSTPRPRLLARLAAASAAAMLALSGCTLLDGGGSGDAPADDGGTGGGATADTAGQPGLQELGDSHADDLPTDPAEDPAYAAFYDQRIQWGVCEDVRSADISCGTITVPIAWDDPEGETIELAVASVEASGKGGRSLVTNPGGPGGSGINFLEYLPYAIAPEVRQAFDIVSFDPRGVGRSAPVECLDDEEIDELRAATAEADSAEADELSAEWSTRLAESCEQTSGEILPYLDTWSSARDMDVLRAAVGAEELDYLGFSYGTYLGSSYAELYPDRVGRFVLDGAMDPTLTMDELGAGQAEGFDKAARAFLSDCLASGDDCPFKGTEDEAVEQLISFFDSVDAHPLPTSDPDRPLTGSLARAAVLSLLYADSNWTTGYEALTDAMNGDGDLLLTIADLSAEREDDATYRTNSTVAISAINCLDHPGATDEQWLEDEAERLATDYPIFGADFGGNGCLDWPVPPLREPAPIAAEGAGPIVVIGTTGDPATPYAWAQSLADQLDDSVLLTFEGNGHTAYGRSGGCIEGQVNAFLVDGTVPEDGLTC